MKLQPSGTIVVRLYYRLAIRLPSGWCRHWFEARLLGPVPGELLIHQQNRINSCSHALETPQLLSILGWQPTWRLPVYGVQLLA
jgi:hypothetical protein